MVGQYGTFILGVIHNSTSPEGIELSNKLLSNWNSSSGNSVPWWAIHNSRKLRYVLSNA